MRCSRVQFLYEDYSSGTLEACTASRLDRHLASCPSCREYFEGNDEVSEIISASSAVSHPGDAYLDDLTSRVLESLCDESGSFKPFETEPVRTVDVLRTASRRPLWWAGAVAALLLVAPMIAGSLRTSESGSSTLDRQVADSSPSVGGTTVSKSAQDLEPGVWGAALPLGQGLVYNAIRPVSLNASRHVVSARTEGTDAQIELGTIEELLALEAVGTVEARQRIYALLRDLGATLHEHYPELEHSSELVLMKQTHLYHRAEDAIQQNDLDAAAENYRNILAINEATILARRAAMRLADLNYYELGNFEEALNYYRMAEDQSAQFALTLDESAHVARRRQQIEQHAREGFASLRLIHQLASKPWSDVPGAFQSILHRADAPQLSSDIAMALMKRLASGSLPPDDTAFELVDLIESNVQSWENPADRGWLYLLLGDIIWLKFESSEPALQAYQSARLLNEQSDSADMARQRIELLRDDKVIVFGR